MAGTLRITRQQLAKFLGNDHDAIRQFETLFSTVADSGPTAVATEPEIVVEAAAHQALDRIAVLERALNQRQTVTLTLSAATGTVNLGNVFEILDEIASAPGRFRLYRTTAGRDADLARSVEVQEPNTVGLLLEDVFLSAALSVSEDPAPCAAGLDGLCAWSWSGALGSTVTLTILVKEA